MKKSYFKNLVCVLSLIFTSQLFSQTALDGDVWTVLPNTPTIAASTINTALANGTIVTFIANQEYEITGGTIEIRTGQTLHIPASVILRFPSSTEAAIKLYGASFNGNDYKSGSKLTGRGAIIGSNDTGIDSNCNTGANNVGILVMGANSKVELGRIYNFGVGVKLFGDSTHSNENYQSGVDENDNPIYTNYGYASGAQYNNIYVAYILYCKIGVQLDSEKDGWTNQNYIHIDEIKGGTDPTCTDWGIHMNTHTRFQPNHNFFSGSIEGALNNGAIYIGGGVNNVFTGLRFETPGNPNHFQLENSTFSGSTSDFKGLPINNFVYGGGSNQISWGNVTGAAKKRDALLFYGSINSDLYNQNHLYTSLKIDRKLGVGTESPSAKLEVNKLRESSGNAIARFGYDKDSIGTRLELWIDPASGENAKSDLDLFASYSRNGADFHIGTVAKKRMMTFLNQTSNTRVGVNQELPNYELDVNGTINALSYLVDGVPLENTLSRNASTDEMIMQGETSNADNEPDNGGVDIRRLYNMKRMITDPVVKENTTEGNAAERNATSQNNARYLFSIEELEENFPELVYVNEENETKSVDYISFIPLMVKKLKEQEEKILQLEAILIGEEANTDIFDSENDGGRDFGAKLYQNIPNPNSSEADIQVLIPEHIETAKLMIFDLQGKKLKEIIINERNQHTIHITSSDFASGMYLYSLVTDGRLVDTKRMIIDN
jgi:hypothetical protein